MVLSLVLYLYVTFLLFIQTLQSDPELKCLVCRKVVEEIEYDISKVSPKKKIQMGGYRIDAKGNRKQNEIQYAGSEIHLHEVLEEICNRMDDYAQGKWIDTKERTIFKLVTTDGKMNPEMKNIELTPDEDLNRFLKYYCENLVEDYEDDILRIFSKKLKDPDIELCTKAANWCQDNVTEDYDFEDRDEL